MSILAVHAVAPDRLLEIAAREIIAREQSRLPNLSGLTVLLPNLHAAGNFGRALSEAAGGATLLLPRFATLRELAGQADPESCKNSTLPSPGCDLSGLACQRVVPAR